MAINIAAFEEPLTFRKRVDELVRQIRDSAPAPGFSRCYAPGEMEFETEQAYSRNGIPLSVDTLAGLAQCETRLRVV
jgi:LDH2 family malate/lactate/ureidoglycolate dehydrogenase